MLIKNEIESTWELRLSLSLARRLERVIMI